VTNVGHWQLRNRDHAGICGPYLWKLVSAEYYK